MSVEVSDEIHLTLGGKKKVLSVEEKNSGQPEFKSSKNNIVLYCVPCPVPP